MLGYFIPTGRWLHHQKFKGGVIMTRKNMVVVVVVWLVIGAGLIGGVLYRAHKEDEEQRARQAHIQRMMEFEDWWAENGLTLLRAINK